jgi:hypothetical protein
MAVPLDDQGEDLEMGLGDGDVSLAGGEIDEDPNQVIKTFLENAIQEAKSNNEVHALREAHERETSKDQELAEWEINKGKSTERWIWGIGWPVSISVTLYFVAIVLALFIPLGHNTLPFSVTFAILATLTLCLPWPQKVGIPNLVEAMHKHATAQGMDPELFSYLTANTALSPRNKTFAKEVRHLAKQWIRQYRPNWAPTTCDEQVIRSMIVMTGPGITEAVAMQHWSRPDVNKGMWTITRWAKDGTLFGGAVMPPV